MTHFIPDSIQPGILCLRAALNCMPDLEHLYLENALENADDFISSVGLNVLQKISVPCLTRLFIITPVSSIVTLLSSISFPLHTKMRLECRNEDDISLDICDQLCHILAQKYSNDHMWTPQTIPSVVMKFSSDQVALAFNTSSECNYEPTWTYSMTAVRWGRNTPLLEMVINLPEPRNALFGSDICISIPTTNIQTLHIINPASSCRTFWEKTSGHLPGLRRMKLSRGCMANGLISILCPQTSGGLVENQRISVPKLDELELDRMRFKTDPRSGSDSDAVLVQRRR